MPLPRLAAPRLVLEPLTLEQLEAAHALWTEAEVRRYLWDDRVITLGQAAEPLQGSESDFRAHGFGLWAVRIPPAVDLAGFCGLRQADFMPEPELLFGLRAPHWGKGLANEAARTVLDYAFSELALPVIGAAADVPNVRSVRLLERLGMRFVRQADVNGQPTRFYRLDAKDWAGR